MKIKLAENIRQFRKERALTQEQLAEVLGVTTGAVYKWEAQLSNPELNLIMEMADFFDTSVDVLLGYEMKDNRLSACIERLKTYRHNKDPQGLAEAEKALRKYPHNFAIVHESSTLYRVFGVESLDRELLWRALELLKESSVLLPQNSDPEISEITIIGEMADVYLMLDEREKSVELLQKHNAGGLYNDKIGLTLAMDPQRRAEAAPFLSDALLNQVGTLIRIIIGYVNVFLERGDTSASQDILLWGSTLLSGLKTTGKRSFLDKMDAIFHICLAFTLSKSGDIVQARSALEKAEELALAFDASPDYDLSSIRFVEPEKPASAYDNLGTTAMESLDNTVRSFANEELSALWQDVRKQSPGSDTK